MHPAGVTASSGTAAGQQSGTHEGHEGTHEGMKGLSSTATGPERLAWPMPISCFHSRPLAPATVQALLSAAFLKSVFSLNEEPTVLCGCLHGTCAGGTGRWALQSPIWPRRPSLFLTGQVD